MSYWILVCAWMFDYQAAGQGEGLDLQLVLLAIYGFALTVFTVGHIGGRVKVRWLDSMVVLGLLYLTVGTLSGIASRDPIYPLLRNGLGAFVYLSAAYATARVMAETDSTKLRSMLAKVCLPYVVAAFLIYNFNSGGIDYAKVRYQIIGASSMAALGYLVLSTMFRLSPLQMVTLLVNLAVLLISVTRTFLVSLVAEFLIVASGLRHFLSRRLIFAGGLFLAIAVSGFVFAGDQVARWQYRLGGPGGNEMIRDQTLFTRMSEWDFMYRSWTGSPGNFLMGSGFNARTQYFNPTELGGGEEYMIGFGHNQHLSMLFNAGSLGGLPLLALMFWFGWMAIRFLRTAAQTPAARSDAIFLGAWGATIVIGTLISDFFAASFILRGQALWYGIGTGLLLGAQARFDPVNAWFYGSRKPPAPQEQRAAG
ncbi:MAG: hypothetical protein KGM49_14765 [Sphingomonadales bacterium]|nr:hypothetical protein [Sphingomonadales bacterium]